MSAQKPAAADQKEIEMAAAAAKDIEGQNPLATGASIVSPPPAPKSSPSLLAPLAGVVFLVVGTTYIQMNVSSNKWKLPTCHGCDKKTYQASIWQTCIIHLAALSLYPIYLADRYTTKLKPVTKPLGLTYTENSSKPFCPQYWWIILGVLDVLMNISANSAYIFVGAATTRVLFALNILLTAILRRLIMKRFPTVYEMLGIGVVSGGVGLGFIAALTTTADNKDYGGKQWIGILFSLSVAVFSSMNFIAQEAMYAKHNASALEASASIGLYGASIDCLLLTLGQFTGIEKVSVTFYQMFQTEGSQSLILMNVIQYICMLIYPISSGVVIKVGSSVLRVVVNTGRTVCIWVVGLSMGKKFGVLEFFGIVCITAGVCVYHYNFIVKNDSWRHDSTMRKEVQLKKTLTSWLDERAKSKNTVQYDPSTTSLDSRVSEKVAEIHEAASKKSSTSQAPQDLQKALSSQPTREASVNP